MKKKFILLISALVVLGIVGILISNTTKTESDNYLDNQVVDGLSFKNANLETSDHNTTYTVEVENTNNEVYNLKYIEINFKDKDDNVIETLIGYVGDSIDSGDTQNISASVDYKVTNIGSIEYEIIAPSNNFTDDSWETIAVAVKSGTYPYKVGDTKTIDMGDFGTHTVRVANTSACTNGETSETACGFVVEFVDVIASYYMNPGDTINPDGTNSGGWPASAMCTYVNETIYKALPSDLQSVIENTTVISGYGQGGTKNFTSINKLYLLSFKEFYGTSFTDSNDTAKDTTRQLDYYANLGVTVSNYSEATKKYNGVGSYYWLRNADYSTTHRFTSISSSGYRYVNIARAGSGVSPAFRIG